MTLPAITSISGSIGARTVCKQALKVGMRKIVQPCVLDDAEAAMAAVRFADDERILVEVACGINVVTCYNSRLKQFVPYLIPKSKTVIVVCGGSKINLDMMQKQKEDWGLRSFGANLVLNGGKP